MVSVGISCFFVTRFNKQDVQRATADERGVCLHCIAQCVRKFYIRGQIQRSAQEEIAWVYPELSSSTSNRSQQFATHIASIASRHQRRGNFASPFFFRWLNIFA
jgi:hypothetical protein